MLSAIHIQNYMLIPELHLDVNHGFTVITGETGAGKSVLIGALHLILGERADLSVVRNPTEKCILEARFTLNKESHRIFFDNNDLDYSEECIIRREIAPGGKSRSFINDTPVNLQQLRALGAMLIDIHSQYDTLLIHDDAFRVQLLDGPAFSTELRKAFSATFNEWKTQHSMLKQLKEQDARMAQECDYLQFQLNELDEAQIVPGTLADDELAYKRLSNAAQISEVLQQAVEMVEQESHGTIFQLKQLKNVLQQAQKWNSELEPLVERVHRQLEEVKDIAFELHRASDQNTAQPEELNRVTSRIDIVNSLLRKHRLNDEQGLIDLAENIRKRLQQAENLSELIEQQEALCEKLHADLQQHAALLRKKRQDAIPVVQKRLLSLLGPLGMPHARIEISLETRSEWNENGTDKVMLLFSANKGLPMADISKTASGGELSRFMLCLKYILVSTTQLPSVVFDEIDTGVSGAVADAMGSMLSSMSEHLQVLCITHLPQIASQGNDHLLVQKSTTGNQTETQIIRILGDERIDHIASMLSGQNLSKEARSNARALMKKRSMN
jgi:DNA repair protein RecN (Recombination protein N)